MIDDEKDRLGFDPIARQHVSKCGACAALLAAAALGGCHREEPSYQTDVSYAVRDPGSQVMPTNEFSFRLIASDGPSRLETLRAIVLRDGKRCGRIRRGVLKGGLDGADSWLVECAEPAQYMIWFRPGANASVEACTGSSCS